MWIKNNSYPSEKLGKIKIFKESQILEEVVVDIEQPIEGGGSIRTKKKRSFKRN